MPTLYIRTRSIIPMKRKSTLYLNYQELARTFQVGMRVHPFLAGKEQHSGVVVAVFPAIGMVDVQFPHGSSRYPVEDLKIVENAPIERVTTDTVPGGLGVVPVSSGISKKAIYWAGADRQYRMSKKENGVPNCPRCRDIQLKKTVYKRVGGKSERLLCCPHCLFLIKPTDILGFIDKGGV